MCMRILMVICMSTVLGACSVAAPRPLQGAAEPARDIVVLLLQSELEIDAKPSRGHIRIRDGKDAAAVMGLALIAGAAGIRDEHPARLVLGGEPGELDFTGTLISGIRQELPATLVSADARVQVTDSVVDYFRKRAEAAPRPTLGLMLRYALSEDLKGLYLNASVDIGVSGRGHPVPDPVEYYIEFAAPSGFADGHGARTATPGFWARDGAAAVRKRLQQAASDLGALIATDLMQPLKPQGNKFWISTAADSDTRIKVKLLEDRGERLLVTDGHTRRLIERAQLRD